MINDSLWLANPYYGMHELISRKFELISWELILWELISWELISRELISRDDPKLENIQKFACRMATGLWDSSYQDLLELVDLPTLECRRLETRLCLLYKIIYKLCYFNPETFTVSTSLSHHAPHNLVLNCPFARTNSYFYSFVPQLK